MTTMISVPDPAILSPAQARLTFRSGTRLPTAGWSQGYAQANLIAVPVDWAYDVLLFCQRNPKPCPVLDVTDPGSTTTVLAPDADLRTDLPGYRVWRDGELADEPTDVTGLWSGELVTFLIGCSFTFEATLADAWLHGPMVVSMRPIPAELVDTAVRLTGRMPDVHGAPVHVGDPAALGIADVHHPQFGDAVAAEAGDVPVFWACGVTPQAAVMASRPPFAITHQPGHMLITDVLDSVYRIA